VKTLFIRSSLFLIASLAAVPGIKPPEPNSNHFKDSLVFPKISDFNFLDVVT
jgi:hypothetical protein